MGGRFVGLLPESDPSTLEVAAEGGIALVAVGGREVSAVTDLQHGESGLQHGTSRAGLPSTVLGKWAGGLLLVFIALLTWTVVGVNFGGLERGTVLTDVVAVGMMGVGVVTFVTALLSRIKFKDRSWVIVLGMIVPALIVFAFVADAVAAVMGVG
jgi:hypothetical protein